MIVDVPTAARLLAEARVVAYPTETVYGLGAAPSLPEACERLRQLKERAASGSAPTRGMSVLVADVEACAAAAGRLPARARALAERYWPGPLTLVVPSESAQLASVATERGVGFRCSPHPTAAALAQLAQLVISTSCNRSGESPCRDAHEVEARFGSEFPVAGGEPAGGLSPSTVVAVDDAGALTLLRAGAIDFAELEALT